LPAFVFQLPQLKRLWAAVNPIATLPVELCIVTQLTLLSLAGCRLTVVPDQIGQMRSLSQLLLQENRIVSIPASLGDLQSLSSLMLCANELHLIPADDLCRLPNDCLVYLHSNPRLERITGRMRYEEDVRPRLAEFADAMHSSLDSIRARATSVAIALQDLQLPAPVTLAVIDALFPANTIKLHSKWSLITAVKHFENFLDPNPWDF
jgi:hypothetical protein